MNIKIIPQAYMTSKGLERSWAVIINNVPRYVFYSKSELDSFLRGLNNGKLQM